MRIAYYNPTLNEPRGAGIHGRALLASWRGQGHEVLCLPWPLVEDPAQRTSRANRAPWLPEPVRTASMDLRARVQVLTHLADLREQLRAFRPRLLIARRNLYDYLLDELLAEPVPCLGEVNAILSLEFAKLNGRRMLPWEQRREARFLRACDALVCVTDEVRKDVHLGRPGDRVVTIQNGVDLAAFSPSVAPDPGLAAWAQDFSVVFAYCGTLSPWHDVGTLARAAGLVAGSLPSAGFLFVGPSEAEVDDLLGASVPPSRVRATGAGPARVRRVRPGRGRRLLGRLRARLRLSAQDVRVPGYGKTGPSGMRGSPSRDRPASGGREGRRSGRRGRTGSGRHPDGGRARRGRCNARQERPAVGRAQRKLGLGRGPHGRHRNGAHPELTWASVVWTGLDVVESQPL